MKPIRALFGLLSQFIPLLLTFIMAGASYWFAIQSEMSLFQNRAAPNPDVSDYYLRNFTVQSHNVNDNKYAMIHSEAAEHLPRGNVWQIQKPEMEQFGPDQVELNGVAELGVYELDTDVVTLQNNVVVESQKDGLTTIMKSEEVVIHNPSNEVRATMPVTVTRPGQRFEANQATLNNDTGELRSQGSIKFRLEAQR